MNKNLGSREAYEKIKEGNTLVIDVRKEEEYRTGHIAGSFNVNVSSPNFSQKISALDKEKEYLVYCRSGGRSSLAQKVMTNLGFKKVCNLAGGIESWERSGLLVEK